MQQALEAGEALLSRFAADRRLAERETELREAVAAARGRLDELRAARQRERDEKEAARKAAEVERKKAIAARKRAEKEEKEAEAAAIAATNAEVEKAVAEELRLRKAAERKAELDAFAVKVRKRWGERMVRVVCSTEEELTTSGVTTESARSVSSRSARRRTAPARARALAVPVATAATRLPGQLLRPALPDEVHRQGGRAGGAVRVLPKSDRARRRAVAAVAAADAAVVADCRLGRLALVRRLVVGCGGVVFS